MSSDYFDYSVLGALTPGTNARSADVNARFAAVEAGFDMLPDAAKLHQDRVTYYTAGGSANALTVTMSPAPLAYTEGMRLTLKLSHDNTDATTVNVNGLGVKNIIRHDGTALLADDLLTGQITEMVYNGTSFQLMRISDQGLSDRIAEAQDAADESAASATAAAASATAAAASAAEAATTAASINDSTLVHKAGAETLTGAKTFSAAILASAGITINSQTLSGLTPAGKSMAEAADAAAQRTLLSLGTAALVADNTLVHLAGSETITGLKTFSAGVSINSQTLSGLTAAGKSMAEAADAAAQRTLLSLGTSALLNVDTDGTLAANSDSVVPSQKAVKTYVDTAVTGLLEFKGSTDCSSNPNYPAASKGDAYVVTVAGKIGGASGTSVDIGDVYVAKADNAGGTQASVGTSWFVLEHNLVGAALQGAITASGLTIATARLAGRTTASTGAIEEISVGSNLSLSGGVLDLATSPVLGLGTTATTAAAGDADTSVATTAFVDRLRDMPIAGSFGERGAMSVITAGLTINTGYAAGTIFGIYNDGATDLTLTQGSGLTLRLGGSTTTGNRTLLKRGFSTVWCKSTTEYIIEGAVT